jgi:hypothetical protein
MNDNLGKIFADAFDFLLFLLPIALPIVLIWAAIDLFVEYKRKKFLNSLEWILLEIIPPADVKRSPAAMELFLLALHQTGGEGDWYAKYIEGKFRSWFSLELVSIGGQVKYFIRTEKKYKSSIESGLYAQYPGIEVYEAKEDYTDGFYYDENKFEMFGVEMKLTQKDPYPIKTYVDYKLDAEQEDEFKIDPIAPVLEFLNTVKSGSNVWFQLIVRAHKDDDLDYDKFFPFFAKRKDNWIEEAKKEVKKIREESFYELEDDSGEKKTKKKSSMQTPGQKETIAALERSISKFAFDVGIRMINIAEKDKFDKGNTAGMLGSWKQYNSPKLNGFKPGYKTDFDWWYQDLFKKKLGKIKKDILEGYKDRNYFWKNDYKGNKRLNLVLNTEELATIYHFLGRVTEAPSISKVDARKAAPPGNLPI